MPRGCGNAGEGGWHPQTVPAPFQNFRTSLMLVLLGTKPGKAGQLCQTKKSELPPSNHNQVFIC
jgi:hypothetical protein